MSDMVFDLPTTDNAVTATLNNLIEVCLDGYEGYMQIARGVKLQLFKALFESYTEQRDEFLAELISLMIAQGEKPSNYTDVNAISQRGWNNIRIAAIAGDAHLIFAECEQGEDAALQAYENALNTPLPYEVRQVIEQQYENILRAKTLISDFRRQYCNTKVM